MGFRLNLKGVNESILVGKDNISQVRFISDTTDNSNARSTDINVGLDIEGKIISSVGTSQEDDVTKKLLLWSLVSAEETDAYKQAILEVVSAGNVLRKFTFNNAFIVDYIENYDDKTGNGTFLLKLRQKKEKIKEIIIEGGYQSEGGI